MNIKGCLLTIIVYMLAVHCNNLFNFICFNAFQHFLRQLRCVAYRLAATSIVNMSLSQTGCTETRPLSTMAATCVESSSVSKTYIKNIP